MPSVRQPEDIKKTSKARTSHCHRDTAHHSEPHSDRHKRDEQFVAMCEQCCHLKEPSSRGPSREFDDISKPPKRIGNFPYCSFAHLGPSLKIRHYLRSIEHPPPQNIFLLPHLETWIRPMAGPGQDLSQFTQLKTETRVSITLGSFHGNCKFLRIRADGNSIFGHRFVGCRYWSTSRDCADDSDSQSKDLRRPDR
jgi:hypothetical protein